MRSVWGGSIHGDLRLSIKPGQQTGFYFEKSFTLAPDGFPVPFTGQSIWHESASAVRKVQDRVLNVEAVRVFVALTFTFANTSVSGALYVLVQGVVELAMSTGSIDAFFSLSRNSGLLQELISCTI